MKKKLFTFMLGVCAMFSLAFFGMNLSPKTNASAFTKSASTYTISGTNAALSIKDGSDTEISADKTTLSDALSYIISTANVEATEPIEVLFDSVVLDVPEQITLSQSFVFSGNLEINNSSTFFTIENNQAELSFVFDTFNITNTTDTFNDFNFISVEGTKKTNITLFNSNFNIENTSTETSHLVNFVSSNNSLLLKGEVITDTTLLCNWKSGIEIETYQNTETPENPIDNFFTDDEGKELTTNPETFAISVPYYTNNTIIKNVKSFNTKRFSIIPNKNFFTVSTNVSNNNIVANTTLVFDFDTNGATFNADYNNKPSNFNFKSTQKINFPTASNMTLANHSFDGWFGVINIDGTDHYFNQTLLSDLLANPDTVLPTSLDEFEFDTSFSSFYYFSLNTENELAEHSAVYYLAEQGLAPKFIAKWNIDTYDITFDSNGGSSISDVTTTYDFGSKVTPPTNPTLDGHTFAGWFTEPANDSGTEIDFETYTVFETKTFYAHWNKNTYTISFVTNSYTITSVPTISYEYGETILPLEPLSETGKVFDGWYEYDGNTVSNTIFETGVSMPAHNIILHAIWKVQKCTIYFYANGGSHIPMYEVNYGSFITPPENPTRVGYIFSGWYHNQTCTEDKIVNFPNGRYEIKKSETFYAKWIPNHYWLSVNKNNGTDITKTYVSYGQNIITPEDPTRANYIFAGWFTNEELTQKLNPNQTMPAKDFTIYAKWTEKPLPTIDINKQIYTTKNYGAEFVNKGTLKGFIVRYYVNEEWVVTPPAKVGIYDIMITRNEDDTYASYHQIIEGAFEIKPVQKNLAWIIIALFIIAAFEFAVAIFVKIMRKMKFNMVVSIAIPLGSTFISSSQVVLLAISGIAAVAGLITMIYQLVKLHRTVPVALFETNTENNTQEQIINHSNKVIEEVQIYSEADIEEMLKHDSVGAAIREKHKLDEKDFSEFEKEKQPIAPVETVEEDDDDDGDLKAVVEIVEDEYIPNTNNDEKLYDSDDPFVRKDPNDYSNSNTDNEF